MGAMCTRGAGPSILKAAHAGVYDAMICNTYPWLTQARERTCRGRHALARHPPRARPARTKHERAGALHRDWLTLSHRFLLASSNNGRTFVTLPLTSSAACCWLPDAAACAAAQPLVVALRRRRDSLQSARRAAAGRGPLGWAIAQRRRERGAG